MSSSTASTIRLKSTNRSQSKGSCAPFVSIRVIKLRRLNPVELRFCDRRLRKQREWSKQKPRPPNEIGEGQRRASTSTLLRTFQGQRQARPNIVQFPPESVCSRGPLDGRQSPGSAEGARHQSLLRVLPHHWT